MVRPKRFREAIADRISFKASLGFSDPFLDSRTIWLFKMRLRVAEKNKVFWGRASEAMEGYIETLIELGKEVPKENGL